MSMMFYVHVPPDADLQPVVSNEGHLQEVSGYMGSLGNFTVHFNELERSKTILKYNYLAAEVQNIAHLKEIVLRHHALFQAKERADLQILGLIGEAAAFTRKSDRKYKANFIVYQATFIPPFELEIYFESKSFTDRPMKMIGPPFDLALNLHIRNFEEKFENIFKLQQKNFSVAHIKAAKAALSNMIGGIGYFYGSSLVQSRYNKEPVNYWNAPLYTAVPARSFFPRGFLWDEGFHNLLILEWNAELTKDIISHWLDLINVDGWIPREQILGPDARERVPAEFIVQKDTNGNPPTFFLTFDALLKKMKKGEIPNDIKFLKRAFPRLKVWFEWFNKTQYGSIPGTYRWRGRDMQTTLELNPKTLTSGLDDYPRATHPTVDERHIDLRCWITLAAGVLADIGEYIGEPVGKYRNTYLFLKDNKLLDALHWSQESKSYSDYGLHSTKVELTKKQIPSVAAGNIPVTQTVSLRVVHEEPVLRFVDNFGYVSLFPFLLKIIDPDNPRLAHILTDLRNPKLLWTNYGLRSLSKISPYYMKYNTEHDPPYWRGSIWINMNYLAVRALEYYSNVDGPYQVQARVLYTDLRKNIINTVFNEFKRTGFLWEQYNDKNGQGKGAHPFTGWSALFILLMGEIY